MAAEVLTVAALARVLGKSRSIVHQRIVRMRADPSLRLLPWPPNVDPEYGRLTWTADQVDAWNRERRQRAETAREALRRGTPARPDSAR